VFYFIFFIVSTRPGTSNIFLIARRGSRRAACCERPNKTCNYWRLRGSNSGLGDIMEKVSSLGLEPPTPCLPGSGSTDRATETTDSTLLPSSYPGPRQQRSLPHRLWPLCCISHPSSLYHFCYSTFLRVAITDVVVNVCAIFSSVTINLYRLSYHTWAVYLLAISLLGLLLSFISFALFLFPFLITLYTDIPI
jgi:hypothetical protein